MLNDEMYSIVVPLNWTSAEVSSELTTMDISDYYDNLVNYFKPYVEAASYTDIIECIRNSLKRLAPSMDCDWKAEMYMEFVFSFFEIFRCTNSVIIRNSLEEYIVLLLNNSGSLHEIFDPKSLLSPFPTRDIYYIMPSGYKKLKTDSFFYESFILEYSFGAQTLLRYGVRFELEDEALHAYLSSFFIESPFFTGDEEEVEKRMRAVIEGDYTTYSDRRRLYFVLLAIEMMFLRKESSVYCFTKSLKLVFETITDPWLTVTEISRFWDLTMKGIIELSDIGEFLSFFVEEFPMAAAPFQPRTLKQLCRCQIRKCLMEAKKLPHGVWSLKIPKRLQNYILLQKTEDEFYFFNVYSLTKRLPMFRRPLNRGVLL